MKERRPPACRTAAMTRNHSTLNRGFVPAFWITASAVVTRPPKVIPVLMALIHHTLCREAIAQ